MTPVQGLAGTRGRRELFGASPGTVLLMQNENDVSRLFYAIVLVLVDEWYRNLKDPNV
jgi:hypothetical protein